MDMVYTDFDPFFSDHYEAAYRLAFILCRNPGAARTAVFQALIALAASAPTSSRNDQKRLMQAVVTECKAYYSKKKHRAPTRERLQPYVPFRISDSLWQAMKRPFSLKAAVFLHDILEYTPCETAEVLHTNEKTVGKALRANSLDLRCVGEIIMEDAKAQALLDDVYLRFTERNVPFELKLRKLKRRVDAIVPYIALAIILFCVAAVIYTANMPVS